MAAPFTKNAKLIRAVMRNDISVVRELLHNGADPDTSSILYEGSLLKTAMDRNYAEIAALLVKAGANDMQALNGQETALTYCADTGKFDCIVELVKTGRLDINKKNTEGDAPIHISIKRGHNAITKFLAENGARPDLPDRTGVTALELARSRALDLKAIFPSQAHADVIVDPSPVLPPAIPLLATAATPPAKEAPGHDGWILLSHDRIARVMDDGVLGRKITDTFNFSARERLTAIENTLTKSETVIWKPFDELKDKTPVEQAYAELQRLGGTVDPSVIHAPPRDKQPLMPERKQHGLP